LALAATLMIGAACSPSALVDVSSPSTVVDPSLVNTATAAAQLRTGALIRMMGAFARAPGVAFSSGLLTDELTNARVIVNNANARMVLNPALSGNANGYDYDAIQTARVKAAQALQALQLYASNTPSVPRAWQGEMYALQGYTLIWFAELFCSGIPLTEVPLVGPQVPTRGFTTEELFNRAIALFDSAVVAGADSAQYVNLAMVGKARALLDLGQFAAADSAVQNVPTNFVYVIPSITTGTDGLGYNYIALSDVPNGYVRVEDHEGGNGLVWSTDPRTAVVTVPATAGAMLWPGKYNITAAGVISPSTSMSGVPMRLADGLEARLIQAEAALARNDGSWLTILNTLRATCVGTAPCAPISTLTDTSLAPLADPGTPAARLDTLMKERAMWLYLTAHREGDLRRMVHVYNRDPNTLWPTGTISDPAFPPLWSIPNTDDGTLYGSDMMFGPDVNEQLRNPLYAGCYNTNP
jgi:hypothetical protein